MWRVSTEIRNAFRERDRIDSEIAPQLNYYKRELLVRYFSYNDKVKRGSKDV